MHLRGGVSVVLPPSTSWPISTKLGIDGSTLRVESFVKSSSQLGKREPSEAVVGKRDRV